MRSSLRFNLGCFASCADVPVDIVCCAMFGPASCKAQFKQTTLEHVSFLSQFGVNRFKVQCACPLGCSRHSAGKLGAL